VKFTGAKNLLEIGTFDGNTALNLAANSPPDARVTTVDLPPDWNGRFEIGVPRFFHNVTDRRRVGLQYQNTIHAHKIHQVYGDSAKIDWTRMPIPFDLVFIDGCHFYEYVKKDTESTIQSLGRGGVLVWHDYGADRHVSKVVDESARRFKVYAIQSTRLAVALVT
jgi:predicted O-methyltransferase YrrM